MGKVKRFSRQMLCNIEELKTRGYFISQISRKLKITVGDVKNGLNKIYDVEEKHLIS